MKIPLQLPPCGLYRTTRQIGPISGNRLVFFHNHGDPGPGLYLPSRWKENRVQLREKGTPLPSPEDVKHLEPLPPEGFYRVTETFYCCDKRCRSFEPETLVQLGYNAEAQPLVFLPELVGGLLAIPQKGTRIDARNLGLLKQLKMRVTNAPDAPGH